MEERDHKLVKYLAIALHYWGRGDSKEEAMKNLREAGFRYGRGEKQVVLYDFGEGVEDAYVDSMGTACWWTPEGKTEEAPRKFWVDRKGGMTPLE